MAVDAERLRRLAEHGIVVTSRPCTSAGCSGTMHLQDDHLDVDVSPAHLEFPRYISFVCAIDSSHVALLTQQAWSETVRAAIRPRQGPGA